MNDEERKRREEEQRQCHHDWKWKLDLNDQKFGICKKCKAVNDDYRTPEISI